VTLSVPPRHFWQGPDVTLPLGAAGIISGMNIQAVVFGIGGVLGRN
jgi:hypothetical protein